MYTKQHKTIISEIILGLTPIGVTTRAGCGRMSRRQHRNCTAAMQRVIKHIYVHTYKHAYSRVRIQKRRCMYGLTHADTHRNAHTDGINLNTHTPIHTHKHAQTNTHTHTHMHAHTHARTCIIYSYILLLCHNCKPIRGIIQKNQDWVGRPNGNRLNYGGCADSVFTRELPVHSEFLRHKHSRDG